MKNALFLIACVTSFITWSQNVQVDAVSYTPQQLIEDILVDSDCITNVVVTNVVGGNFNGVDQSYGYFDAAGSSFPFATGVVLTTGRLNNVAGPNTTLSDDDAPNWTGDSDLETILNETNTLNATILEFEFESVASQVSFRYIFASEEYQEGNGNTCEYSDLFGFLIRQATDSDYENIALVPDTTTPVKVTTVHPGIPGSCDPINEAYFGSWNNASAPINFNGQTAILTATADVVPNTTYHVKLVIADEQNYRYDSAVFLEAGSFQLSTELGRDRLIANNTALCTDETLQLDASQPGMNTYQWFQNDNPLPMETNPTYTVTSPGVYSVEVSINGTCISNGSIIIEYAPDPIVADTTLIACDYNLDGFTTYNLYDAVTAIAAGDQTLTVTSFYESEAGAAGTDADLISTPSAYNNTQLGQTVYARVINSNGCIAVAEIYLDYANNPVNLPPYSSCDEDNNGIVSFDLNTLEAFIVMQPDVPNTAAITFYVSQADLVNQNNPITGTYENNINPYSDMLFVQIFDSGNCYAFTTLTLNVFNSPELAPNEDYLYCLNSYPDTLTLETGVLNGLPSAHNYQWFLNGADLFLTTETIQVNTIGTYTVVVTNQDGCSSIRELIVNGSNLATIENINVVEASANNTITITVSGEGDYEYALDYGPYQMDNHFSNVAPGVHLVLVRDKNGCGIVTEEVLVFGFPKFFTPNDDGDNDTWKPLGVSQVNTFLKIQIFDRYGKLLKELNAAETGWNGTFQGKQLPTDDYWYLVTLPNGKEYQGHFALVR